jgi:hypothetical protein
MTTDGKEPAAGRKRDRFIIQDNGIDITGRRVPSAEEREEADRVFSRILKNRKQGHG